MRRQLWNEFSEYKNISNICMNIILNRYRKNFLCFFTNPRSFLGNPAVCTSVHMSYDGVLSETLIRTMLRAAKNNYVDTSQWRHRTTIATVSSAIIKTKQSLGSVNFRVLILYYGWSISYISYVLKYITFLIKYI